MKDIKLFGIAILCMVLIVGTVSALEFDNIKSYDKDIKTVTIKNAFGLGDDIITGTLDTLQVNRIGIGYQKVAEFTLNPKQDYDNLLGSFEFKDRNDNDNPIEKQIDIKYYTIETIEIDEYKETCSILVNGTSQCINEVSGKKNVQRSVWKDFNNSVKTNKEVTIGLFANVSEGEHIEWIPTIAGVEVDEWAEWTASLNVNLISYYKLDAAAGIVKDEIGKNNGTNQGATRDVTGQINKSFKFDADSSEWANTTFRDVLSNNFTISLWMNTSFSPSAAGDDIIARNDGTSSLIESLSIIDGTDSIVIATRNGTAGNNGQVIGSVNVSDNTWHHVVMTRNDTFLRLYVDGADDGSQEKDYGVSVLAESFRLGESSLGTLFYNGSIDEVGIWNRTLTGVEVTQLYNGGTGITHTSDFDSAPIVTMSHPINNSNFISVPQTITVNATVSDDQNITKVELYVNGALNQTNVSAGIYNNSVFTFTVPLGQGTHTMYINATDNATTKKSTTGETRYVNIMEFFLNAFFWNSSSFETASETFTVNITTNGSVPANAELIYNGSTFTGGTVTNIAGNNYNLSRTIDVLTGTGNKTFNFNFTLEGKEFNTTTNQQNISLTNWTRIINEQPRLNITFKNETIGLETVSATFNSEFFYWLGSGTVHKQLSFSDASENLNYSFALPGIGTRDLNVNISTTFSNSISQQRQFSQTYLLNNGTTNQTLFLLPTSDGIFVTFQVVNTADQVLSGVAVNATQSGNLISSGLTDDAGVITFFLNPNLAYTFTFVKAGFESFTTTLTPTQSSFTITLGGGVTLGDDFSKGISYDIDPKNETLQNNTVVTFNFNITSSFFTLEKFGFILSNSTGTQFNTTSDTTGTGGNVTILIDTSTNTDLIMDFFWLIEGNFSNSSRTWLIRDQTDLGFSVKTFFDDLSTYLNSGIFGLTSFGLGLIVFIIIFLITGVLSSQFGITSPASISITIFVLVLFFDVGVGIIPNPINAIPNFITILVGLITLGVLVKEGSR